MGQARLQRHESDLLEDEAREGRVLERHGRVGLELRRAWRRDTASEKVVRCTLDSMHGIGAQGQVFQLPSVWGMHMYFLADVILASYNSEELKPVSDPPTVSL